MNLAPQDRSMLGKIADEKKGSIASGIRDAMTRYLTEQPQKIRGVTLQMSHGIN
jgi:hypothetical protein